MMMTLSELSTIVGGQLHGADAEFNAVCTDSRTLNQGDVFFALRGERFDAADFVAQAAEKHAAGAVVEQQADTSLPQVQVNDTRMALADFARAWRHQSGVKLIGITGSNGKTTVKELTASICRAAFADEAVLATLGNFNNDIGLPLTLLQLRKQHQVAVTEMGANQPGDIALLAGIAAPDVVVINNVARAHIEGFGSLDGVAQTKGELLDDLNEANVAILNRDDAYFSAWQERAGSARIVTFGAADDADFRATKIQAVVRRGKPAFSFELVAPAGTIAVALPLAGRHSLTELSSFPLARTRPAGS